MSKITTEADFLQVLTAAQKYLEQRAKRNTIAYEKMSPELFEKEVADALNRAVKSKNFEDKIALIGGHRFPDISVGERFGVEVKTAKTDHWRTLGNSVLESTRIPGVEIIYIFFAKLGKQPEFKFRLYQECLAEVQITHSPRYAIDMELPKGNSIFDKMGKQYDEIRTKDHPINEFIEYYKRQNKGDTSSVWWLNTSTTEKAIPLKMTFFKDVDVSKKSLLVGQMLFLFPEIFGATQTKYYRPVAWLVKNHSILSPCIRDCFSAGGKGEINYCGKTYKVPQIVITLEEHKKEFRNALADVSLDDIREFYNISTDFPDSPGERFDLWYTDFCQAVSNNQEYPQDVKDYIKALIAPEKRK